jgi:hypothetical protein
MEGERSIDCNGRKQSDLSGTRARHTISFHAREIPAPPTLVPGSTQVDNQHRLLLSHSRSPIMTATTSEAPALPKHAWSAQYLRLRAIAILLGIPTRLIVNLAYYCYDPFTLRKYQVQRRRIWIPSRERGRTIKVDVYEPIKRTKKPLPVHINWHGSGFGECPHSELDLLLDAETQFTLLVIPCHGVDATLCIYLASTLGCTVLDADYRKAPAHPFPAGQQGEKRASA